MTDITKRGHMHSRPEDEIDDAANPALTWQIACTEVDRASPKAGLEQTLTATAAERQALVEALDLTACSGVKVLLTARARAGGRYTIGGRTQADIEQRCVVTLEPIHTHLDLVFSGEFCPRADIAAMLPPDTHFDPDSEDEPMAIIDGFLPVGQLVYEHLALAVDPFPRRADAEAVMLERGPDGVSKPGGEPSSDSDGSGKPNPFAALAKLKLSKDD